LSSRPDKAKNKPEKASGGEFSQIKRFDPTKAATNTLIKPHTETNGGKNIERE